MQQAISGSDSRKSNVQMIVFLMFMSVLPLLCYRGTMSRSRERALEFVSAPPGRFHLDLCPEPDAAVRIDRPGRDVTGLLVAPFKVFDFLFHRCSSLWLLKLDEVERVAV